ncbi:MAG: GNAT family N-acetyltransferase [Planctomycetota bacterium]
MSHVQLHPVQVRDLELLFEIQNDAQANAMAVANPRTREEFFEHWRRVLADPAVVARTIVMGGRVSGSISCFELDERTYVGYWIARESWGRGIATSALQLFLDEVEKRPLWARVAISNVASTRVLEKCGFVEHARMMSEVTPRFPACEESLMRLDA